MTDREIEADAWEVEAPESMQDSRGHNTAIVRHFTYVPAHERGDKEPLYSSSTIIHHVRFEETARRLEHFARRLEVASTNPFDKEEVLTVAKELKERADEIAKMDEEVDE